MKYLKNQDVFKIASPQENKEDEIGYDTYFLVTQIKKLINEEELVNVENIIEHENEEFLKKWLAPNL